MKPTSGKGLKSRSKEAAETMKEPPEANTDEVSNGAKESHQPMKKEEKPLGEMRKRKQEEHLAKKAQEDAEREQFVREMADKKARERSKIMEQAKSVMFRRKPLCRRINQGLLLSECLRELEDQVELRAAIKAIDKELEMKYVDLLKSDTLKYEMEEREKAEEQRKKMNNYNMALRKQIEENEAERTANKMAELESEKEEQANMTRYLQLLKEHEIGEMLKKKKRLEQSFKDDIAKKSQFAQEMKLAEEFEDRALEVYRAAKARIRKMHKEVERREKEEREEKAELAAKILGGKQTDEKMAAKILKKAVEEQEAAEMAKQAARRKKEDAMRSDMRRVRIEAEAAKGKEEREKRELKAWEMMQRFKRDEYDKEMEVQQRIRERKKKLEYADVLQKHVEEKEAEELREKALEELATSQKTHVEEMNKKILEYGKEVLESSMGVRPLYPILKAIQECEKEMGLKPTKKLEEVAETKPKRKQKSRRVCTKPVPEKDICYL